MQLLVGTFIEPVEGRLAEYVHVLERNIANGFIGGVHLFIEDDPASFLHAVGNPPNAAVAKLAELLAHDKVAKIVRHGRRTTYGEFFGYANEHLAGQTVCVSNSDIIFDETLGLLEGVDLTDVLVCLAKYDDGRLAAPPEISQDSWIFRSPIRKFPCDWHLGRYFCELRMSYEAARAGLRLANPCHSVRAHHHHRTELGRPKPTVPGPITESLRPTGIDALPKKG